MGGLIKLLLFIFAVYIVYKVIKFFVKLYIAMKINEKKGANSTRSGRSGGTIIELSKDQYHVDK